MLEDPESSCKPVETVDDLFPWQRKPITLDPFKNYSNPYYYSQPAYPCGLQAKYIFSDSILKIYDENGVDYTISQDDISHSYEDRKFKNYKKDGEADNYYEAF